MLLLSAAFFMVFLIVSGALFLYRAPGGGSTSAKASLFSEGGAVGVVELNGVIMDSKKTLNRLEQFEENDDIKAVVLRLNSPGGAVAPSQEIYQAVKAYKKPIIASMSSVAASGAYYVACGAQKIYANPGTITGSIGVIMEFINLEKLYEWAKVQRYSIKTGVFKDAGAEYRDMTPQERALLQAMVDDVLTQFKEAVVTGRKIPAAEVDAVADGRIFSGSQAKAAKLVDQLGTLQDAIAEAGKLGKLKGKPHVVYAEKKRGKLLSMLLDDHDSMDDESSSNFGGVGGSLGSSIAGLVKGALPPRDAQGVTPGIYWLWNPAR